MRGRRLRAERFDLYLTGFWMPLVIFADAGHSNLKPENIFITSSGIVLTDPFFLAGRTRLKWLPETFHFATTTSRTSN